VLPVVLFALLCVAFAASTLLLIAASRHPSLPPLTELETSRLGQLPFVSDHERCREIATNSAEAISVSRA
jgi:hypothetical protein